MSDKNKITAGKLMQRYSMSPHVENGFFIERHYEADPNVRAASGSIYYYVAPQEKTGFHRIDCDEYWCFAAGAPLSIWTIDEGSRISVSRFGIDEGCEPVIYFRRGVIFASQNHSDEGTFLSCITVPRFSPDGFEMFTEDEITSTYPEAKDFFE